MIKETASAKLPQQTGTSGVSDKGKNQEAEAASNQKADQQAKDNQQTPSKGEMIPMEPEAVIKPPCQKGGQE